LPFAITWMDLEGTMLGEISQTEKDKCSMISLICGIFKKTNSLYRKQISGYYKQGVQWVKWVKGLQRYKLLVVK